MINQQPSILNLEIPEIEFSDPFLNFCPEISKIYEIHNRDVRAKYLRRSIFIGLVIYNVYNLTDKILVNDVAIFGIIARVLLVTPVGLILAFNVHRLGPKVREALLVAATFAALSVPLGLFWVSRDPLAGYSLCEIPLVMVFGAMMLRLRFPSIILFLAFGLLGSLAALLLPPRFDPSLAEVFMIQLITAAIFLLFGSYNFERMVREGYLDTLRQMMLRNQSEVAYASAENIARTKSEFLANMSHEIRTPLNGILTMTEIMDRGALSEEQRSRLGVVRQSGQDLLRLLSDILDFSKIEAGKLELEEIAFDVEDLLTSTLASFAPLADQKGLELRLDLAPSAKGWRRGDPARLRQIAANFISNAIKFTASGEVSVRLIGLGVHGQDGLQLAVKDSGIGIPEEKMGRLFQKFSQVDASTTRHFGGTGLGLAICMQLASLMNGRVWAVSEEGRGSTFFAELALPQLDAAALASPAAARSASPLQSRQEEDVRAVRVLAAEDNPTNQLVLSTIMEMFGFELTIVSDGVEALEAWRAQAFDVILMDVHMPRMDGVDATRAIRREEAQKSGRRTPIIALTANAFPHQVLEYRAAGMDLHVTKPLELDALKAALEEALSDEHVAEVGTIAHVGG
jgi:signal transduction histidine kinase/ActR/RegA family two-component response regulator